MSAFTTKPYVTPAIGNRFSAWWKIWNLYSPKPPIPFKYKVRGWVVTLVVILLAPFRLYERLMLGRKVKDTVLQEPPVFIIGHWRSGTTHIHNLLAEDEQFGVLTHFACMFPHVFMKAGFIQDLLRPLIPPKRPMDNMALHLGSPQEEELALLNITPNSYFAAWHFPHHLFEHYKRCIRFENAETEKKEWKNAYQWLLKKTTLANGGKRLVLKNPPNTGRLKTLLELYPDAKFIFIHRDPLAVYVSTKNLYRKNRPQFELETITAEEEAPQILDIQADILKAYLLERSLVPAGNLVEISYDELDKQPMQTLELVYEKLSIAGFQNMKPKAEKYLESVKNFEKNKFQLDENEVKTVKEKLDFAYREWGY